MEKEDVQTNIPLPGSIFPNSHSMFWLMWHNISMNFNGKQEITRGFVYVVNTMKNTVWLFICLPWVYWTFHSSTGYLTCWIVSPASMQTEGQISQEMDYLSKKGSTSALLLTSTLSPKWQPKKLQAQRAIVNWELNVALLVADRSIPPVLLPPHHSET
jgi:hypothetical protein